MLSEETLPLYYDQFYHQLCFGDLKQTTQLFGSHQGRLVFERLWNAPGVKIKNRARVLEIGARLGKVLQEFGQAAGEKSLEVSLLGTEYSSECLKIINGKGIFVIEGGCREVLEKFDEPFDVLILSHLLEHVADLDQFMEHFLKLASPETLIYIEVPGVLTLHANPEYGFDFIKYFTHAHCVHYNLATFKYHMGRYGLTCQVGNETAYGLFRLNSAASPYRKPKIAEQMIFYLANMEATSNSTDKVMERHGIAERKNQLLNEQMKTQALQLEQQKYTALVEQRLKLDAELGVMKTQFDQEIIKKQAEIERQIKMRQHLKKTFYWRVTAPIRSLTRLIRPNSAIRAN